MTPTRTSSEVAKLISRLSRSEDLPEPWKPGDLISLIMSYKDLISTITKPSTVDDNMQRGRVGAYEDMVAKAGGHSKT